MVVPSLPSWWPPTSSSWEPCPALLSLSSSSGLRETQTLHPSWDHLHKWGSYVPVLFKRFSVDSVDDNFSCSFWSGKNLQCVLPGIGRIHVSSNWIELNTRNHFLHCVCCIFEVHCILCIYCILHVKLMYIMLVCRIEEFSFHWCEYNLLLKWLVCCFYCQLTHVNYF